MMFAEHAPAPKAIPLIWQASRHLIASDRDRLKPSPLRRAARPRVLSDAVALLSLITYQRRPRFRPSDITPTARGDVSAVSRLVSAGPPCETLKPLRSSS